MNVADAEENTDRSVPHSLNATPSSTICLITATPQRAFKDAIAHPSFPAELRSRITRVIDLTKLRAKYKSYESRRQLLREHDIFLADDRVKLSLPNALGKVFYKTTTKRPVPVVLSAKKRKEEEGSRRKVTPLKPGEKSVAAPIPMANEINRALSSVLVHISPSTSTAVRIGRASWDEKKVVENVETVVQGMVEKFVPRKWQNVKSLHIKGPNTTGLPLWMSDELWVDEQDVVENPPEPEPKDVNDDGREMSKRKRKRRKQETADGVPKKLTEHADAGDGEVDDEMARARQRIKKQKMEAMGDLEDDAVLARSSKRPSKEVGVA